MIKARNAKEAKATLQKMIGFGSIQVQLLIREEYWKRIWQSDKIRECLKNNVAIFVADGCYIPHHCNDNHTRWYDKCLVLFEKEEKPKDWYLNRRMRNHCG